MQVAELPLVYELNGVHTPPTGAVRMDSSPLLMEIHRDRKE